MENTYSQNEQAITGEAPWHEKKQGTELQETERKKPYQLRKLCADDIFPIARIIGKLGIDELISCVADDDITEILMKLVKRKKLMKKNDEQVEMSQENEGEDKEFDTETFVAGGVVITRIINKVLLRLDDCRTDIYIVLSNLSGIKHENIKKLDAEIFLEMITDVIMKEEFKNFYKVALRFIK